MFVSEQIEDKCNNLGNPLYFAFCAIVVKIVDIVVKIPFIPEESCSASINGRYLAIWVSLCPFQCDLVRDDWKWFA